MSVYTKRIQAENDLVIAEVFRARSRCQLKFFSAGLFTSLEAALKKAHAWADNKITLLEKYEATGPEVKNGK